MPWKPQCCKTDVISDKYKFNKVIQIQTSTFATGFGTNGETQYTTVLTTFASIQTKATRLFDNGVNISTTPTTLFYIRYNASLDLDLSYWILYNNKIFKIDNIENIDEDNEVIKFVAIEKGSVNISANKV